jgi:two-component system, OmpR family, phosphate regulon sensor histidine kinase PhoR
MHVSSPPDISLYELALSSEQPATPLQVSPATLKSIIDSTIDVLIEYKIPATLWVKLPRNEVWQAQIRRCWELANTANNSVYIFSNLREETEEGSVADYNILGVTKASEGSQSLSEPALLSEIPAPLLSDNGISLVDDQGIVVKSTPQHSHSISIPLLLESQLKREYFLVVVSEQLCSLTIAHRPRSVRVTKTESAVPKSKPLEEDTTDRKHPLLALHSFDPPMIQKVLEGLKQAIEFSQFPIHGSMLTSKAAEPGSGSTQSRIDWNHLFTQCNTCKPNLSILNQLVIKQVQRQEDLWHRTTVYRKQAEAAEALQIHNEDLLNSIRYKDEFFSNVGQELRTPLTNMKTALTLLNSPHLKPAQRQRYMQVLTTECDRQSSLITSLLDLVQLSRDIEQATMQPIPLNEIVPAVVSTYQPLAQEKGVMLAYTVPENLPPVSCLSTWLKQISINLLHNGVKFTPSSGQVWVRAKQQGDYVQLEFRDTGIGIPMNEIPKIFDRFYRVRQPAGEELGGAGLGLTIVQQILLRCGGSISVKSKLGEGSTFNVLLPIYKSLPESHLT